MHDFLPTEVPYIKGNIGSLICAVCVILYLPARDANAFGLGLASIEGVKQDALNQRGFTDIALPNQNDFDLIEWFFLTCKIIIKYGSWFIYLPKYFRGNG